MIGKRLIPALFIGLMAVTAAPAIAAPGQSDTLWGQVEIARMKKDMDMMKEGMEMMKKAEKTKDKAMAMKGIEMMKQYLSDYEKLWAAVSP